MTSKLFKHLDSNKFIDREFDNVYNLFGAWTDYSSKSTITGWASYTNKSIRYKQVGKLVFVQYYIRGTSNATSVSFTLPVACANNSNGTYATCCLTEDNGSGTTTGGLTQIIANTSTVLCYKDMAAASWTNSGTKQARGELFYEVA